MERRMHAGGALLAGVIALVASAPAASQSPPPSGGAPPPAATTPAAPATAAAKPAGKTFSQQELDQLMAPIALYPDALLAQVLMASTYPLDVVEADRWVKANPSLKGKALEEALQKQSWDPSVRSLALFPQVLTMMSEKLDWTQKLGDAFLAQSKDLMDTAQSLRKKASDQGNLKSNEQQKVTTETVQNTTVIKIEPAKPETVYVPTYNPTVVYGSWWWPTYPPYYYYPPGYVAGGALLGFTAGVIVGGALWGNMNWGGGDVNIDVDRHNNFNKTNISNKNFQHDSSRRGSVPYGDKGTAQKYGKGQAQGAQSREQFRGRAESGQQAIQRGEVSRDLAGRDLSSQGAGSARDRAGAGAAGDRAGAGGSRDFGGGGGGISAGGSAQRNFGGTGGGSAFSNTGGASQARDSSSRGSSSLSSSRGSSGMSRGGGGGGGGGGRGGGGGGRGGGRR